MVLSYPLLKEHIRRGWEWKTESRGMLLNSNLMGTTVSPFLVSFCASILFMSFAKHTHHKHRQIASMNISLAGVNKSKKKAQPSSFGFGLNQRGGGSKKQKAAVANVFGDDDDEEEESKGDESPPANNSASDARAVVNQALRKEQDALRQRAKKAMQAHAASDVYDYDGAYDSFKQSANAETNAKTSGDDNNKKSRYISNLLKTAQERKLDRDIAYERKVAKEQQQEEDDNVELRGKERFVTASYKRKLEERKLWQEEQDERHKQEEDVTTKEGGMANFYGNLNQNVAMGGTREEDDTAAAKKKARTESPDDKMSNGMKFLEGAEQNGGARTEPEEKTPSDPTRGTISQKQTRSVDPETQRKERRRAREEKVAQAKIRYMQRHGIEA